MAIRDIYFYCALQGENFDPIPLLNLDKFTVADYHCVGDWTRIAKLRGEPQKTGYICLEAKGENFEGFVNNLFLAKELITENNTEVRELHIFLEYENQCNWWFDASLLKIIGELNLDLTISCSEVEDNS